MSRRVCVFAVSKWVELVIISPPAPTVDRNFAKMLLAMSRVFSFSAAPIDVTHAFPQSTRLADSDRYVAICPSYMALGDLTRHGQILGHFPLGYAAPSHAVLCNRPLYGPRCAPRRWYLAIDGVLGEGNFRFRRSDVCIFKRDSATGAIPAFLILHVDDIPICASVKDLGSFRTMIFAELRTGPPTFVDKEPLLFCGLRIRLQGDSIGVSQDEYRLDLPEVNRCHFFGDNRLYRAGKKLGKITRDAV